LKDAFMLVKILTAASLGAALIAAQPAPAAPLTYDCQAYITRVEKVPPPVAGDADPWQCKTPSAQPTTATHWFRNSLEYCRLVVNVYDDVLRAARRIAATHRRNQWIVLMDADETVLDNSLFERERNICGNEFHDAQWESWVHADLAGALPGAAAFTQGVHRLGGLVGIITNRIAADDVNTQRVLRRSGIWFDYEMGMSGTVSDKTQRWRGAVTELTHKFGGHPRAVLWLGDQVTDFPILGRKGEILRPMSQKDSGAGIGTSFFVLPNPMYGNWQDNPEN
jgi:5'-nucleotidase (lipoprotein e(P4) family)